MNYLTEISATTLLQQYFFTAASRVLPGPPLSHQGLPSLAVSFQNIIAKILKRDSCQIKKNII